MNRFFVPLLLVLLANTGAAHAQYRQPGPFEGATHQQEALASAGVTSPYQAVFPNEVGPHAEILLGLEARRRWWVYVMTGAAVGAGTVVAATLLPFSPLYFGAFDDPGAELILIIYAPAAAVLGGLIGGGCTFWGRMAAERSSSVAPIGY